MTDSEPAISHFLLSYCVIARENIRFSSLFVAEDVSRDEERGETDVFAG